MRQPNFKYDDEVYGAFGENDFVEFANSIGYSCFDVSNNEYFQIADVDFLISKQIKMGYNTVNGKSYQDIIFDRNK